MNQIFRSYLRKFALIFFDDIHIYIKKWTDHIQHLIAVLQILQQNLLHAKESKCRFGCSKVDYLGHVIIENGIAVGKKKLESIVNWPLPKSPKAMRGFLGLTGYYRKFFR